MADRLEESGNINNNQYRTKKFILIQRSINFMIEY